MSDYLFECAKRKGNTIVFMAVHKTEGMGLGAVLIYRTPHESLLLRKQMMNFHVSELREVAENIDKARTVEGDTAVIEIPSRRNRFNELTISKSDIHLFDEVLQVLKDWIILEQL